MKRSALGAIMALLIAVICLPACAREEAKPTPTPAGPTEVVFGALVSRTGSLSELGKSSEPALEIAVSDINAYLGAIGSKLRVKLLIEDSATDPTVALEKLKALAQKGAKVVIGPHSSAEVRAIKAFADENGVLILSQSSTASSLAVAGDNVLRFCPNDLQQAEAVARLAWEDGIRALVPMWRGDVWGDDLWQATKVSFERLGGTASDGVRYATDTADFAAAVASLDGKVKQAAARYGAAKVAVVLDAFDEVVPILLQAQGYATLAATK